MRRIVERDAGRRCHCVLQLKDHFLSKGLQIDEGLEGENVHVPRKRKEYFDETQQRVVAPTAFCQTRTTPGIHHPARATALARAAHAVGSHLPSKGPGAKRCRQGTDSKECACDPKRVSLEAVAVSASGYVQVYDGVWDPSMDLSGRFVAMQVICCIF
jgi:hypothetical protein